MTTATTNAKCVGGAGGSDIRPYYWEIGDATGTLASGSVSGPGDTPVLASTRMPIASASKWFYSTYWVQRQQGALTAVDIQYFNFLSGYTQFSMCTGAATVGDCLNIGTNGVIDPTTVGKFDYGGGHMQNHAARVAGLGGLDDGGLASEIRSQVGTDVNISYSEPQLAGGGIAAATDYARMLSSIVSGNLGYMKAALGTHAVCASPSVCPGQAISSPAPPGENWSYSVGHWVEDPSNASDGAFSSPGAFGFYPWIDRTKTYYGVVSRTNITGALTSVYCGRRIRKAWMTGVAQ